jgi:site-specific DNA-methyltransferase (adenine-specific)
MDMVRASRFWESGDGRYELWLADALDPEQVATVLGGRTPRALIVDAPYSEQTHSGHKAAVLTIKRAVDFSASQPKATNQNQRRYASRNGGLRARADITYAPWSADDVERFVDLWSPLTMGWMCSLTDHILFPHWAGSAGVNGRVAFAPLPFVETGSRVRMVGDGPSSWTCWLSVSRPRGEPWSKWGALRGAYVLPGERYFNAAEKDERIIGGKPIGGMCMIVSDYSRRGDLVVDPCCGAGTTLVAARMMGRPAIGIDTCREHLEIAARRIARTREQVTLLGAEQDWGQSELFAPPGEKEECES